MNEVDRKLAGAGTRLQGLECGAGVAVPERDITRPRYRNRVGQRLARTSTSSLSHDEQEELVEFMEEAQWPYGSGGKGRREGEGIPRKACWRDHQRDIERRDDGFSGFLISVTNMLCTMRRSCKAMYPPNKRRRHISMP